MQESPEFPFPDLPVDRRRVALTRLDVRCLRNLESVALAPGPGANVVLGPNGAGKTSFLEAVWMLGRGRSFRSGRIDQVVREGQNALRVVGRVSVDGEGEAVIGVERGRGTRRVRVDGREVESMAEPARLVPAVVFEPHAHELVEGGPEQRRRLMDWGVFHVEPAFLASWRDFQRSLRQRNVCLRQGDLRGARGWEQPMAVSGTRLSAMRERYAGRLGEVLPVVLGALAPELEGIEASYRPGWDPAAELGAALAATREPDRRAGFTTVGPHRGELKLTVNGRAAGRRLSRGQEKLLALGLILAQTALFIRDRHRTPVVLLDDLPSELDGEHLARVVRWVAGLGAQLFATSVAWPEAFEALGSDAAVFHVEHGAIKA